MKYEKLVKLVSDHPLAILPAKLDQIEAFLQFRMAGGPSVPYQAASRPAYAVDGQVAVIPVFGTITQRAGLFSDASGMSSTAAISSALAQAVSDPSVRAIVLQIDSPGGSVYGIQELAAEIVAAKAQKRVVAIADSQAASAAYWLGSAADTFVVTPSGEVGSIGVVAMHVDQSGALAADGVKVTYIKAGDNKVEGNPYEPLTESAQTHMQARVNDYYSAFVGDVARNRGVQRSTVLSSFGQGRVYGADQAKEVGMVDRIATFSDVVRGLQPRTRSASAVATRAVDADIAEAILKAS